VHVYHLLVHMQTPVALSDEHVGYAWTKRPNDGLDLAGNTNKMIDLWKERN